MSKILKINHFLYAGLLISLILMSPKNLTANDNNHNESQQKKQVANRITENNDKSDIRSSLQVRISVNWENTSINDAIKTLQTKGNMSFSERSIGRIANEKIQDVRLVNMKISNALDFIFAGTDFEWFIENDTIAFRRRKKQSNYPPDNSRSQNRIMAQADGGQNNPWTFDNNDNNDVVALRGRRPSPSLASRSHRLSGLIRNVIEPNTWRVRDEEPEEVEEDTWW